MAVTQLAIYFLDTIKELPKRLDGKIDTSPEYKKKILSDFKTCMDCGKTQTELIHLMDSYKKDCSSYKDTYGMMDILSYYNVKLETKHVKEDTDNLMMVGKFYYHQALQNVPPAPVVKVNDDGTFESSYETDSFFLEIKQRYTLDDLVQYFVAKMSLTLRNDNEKERMKGAFRKMLESYSLDLLLFTIDEAKILCEDYGKRLPNTPFRLSDFIQDGEMLLDERKNVLFEGGLDHVKPRTV